MFQLAIRGTNMGITGAIREYVEKKATSIERFVRTQTGLLSVDVGKTTNHHKHGAVYRAELRLSLGKTKHYAVSEKEDLYAAIDDAREELVGQLTTKKDKTITLFKKGSQKIKDLIHGVRFWKK